jgi:hypothetical protein
MMVYRGAVLPYELVEEYKAVIGKRNQFGKPIKMSLFGFTSATLSEEVASNFANGRFAE